jgi:fatty acid desaturase
MVEWTDRNRRLRTVGMFIHLFTYTALMMILPFFVHSSWIWALVAIVVHVGTSGLIFAIFSQINHLNEPSLDPIAFQKRRQQNTHVDFRLEESWAVAQIETSNNFCPKSALWHFLSNGLNLQIEHHLFPGLNHCHLHRIQPVVQEVCQEYGVCYKSYNSWQDLMQATLEWLERLSIEPEQVKCD